MPRNELIEAPLKAVAEALAWAYGVPATKPADCDQTARRTKANRQSGSFRPHDLRGTFYDECDELLRLARLWRKR